MRIRDLAPLILVAGCGGGAAGKIMADTPVLPYQPPDIDELTGIDSEPEEPAPASEPGAGSASAAPLTLPTSTPAPLPTPKPTPKPETKK